MKATGIVRRIDQLGRIVIPKELRNVLQIHNGDPVEIFTDRNNEIVLKKYTEITGMVSYAESFADAIYSGLSVDCLVTDMHKVITASGENADLFVEKALHREFLELLYWGEEYRYADKSRKLKVMQGVEDVYCWAAVPIVSLHRNKPLGSILLTQAEPDTEPDDNHFVMLSVCSRLFAKLIG
jgi:AbrB family transcriptional regulator (stage V sporulation protein T)